MEKKKIEKNNQFWENAGKFFAGVFVVFLMFRPYIKKVINEEIRKFEHKSVTFSKGESDNKDSSKIKIIPLKTWIEQKNKKLSNTKKEIKAETKPQTQKNNKKKKSEISTYEMPCIICHQSGRCYLCGGTGTIYNVAGAFPCGNCMGYGMCQNCEGLGYCTTYHYSDGTMITSNGTMVTSNGTRYSRDGVTNIYSSSSGGSNSSTSSSSSKYSKYDNDNCPSCHGSGRCSVCAGRGEMEYDRMSGERHDCWDCNGSGNCTFCYGSGKMH